jgi:hypothetical protein
MGSLSRATRASLARGIAGTARRIPLLILVAGVGLVAFEEADGRAAAGQPPAPAVQSSSSSAPAGAVGHQQEVIITGRAELEAKISSFVDLVTDFDLGDPSRGLARWQVPVCPLVSGLPRSQGEYILGRVSDIAQAAGAPLAGERCRPNLFILVSTHSQTLLQDLQKRRLFVFGGATPDLVDEFIASPRPVRTWYDTVQRTAEGLPMVHMSFPGISQQHYVHVNVVIPVQPIVPEDFTTNAWSHASHLTLNEVWAIYQAFVIIDPTRFKGVSLQQLADYASMAGLAQIKLGNDLGDAPTILTLFDKDPQAGSAGLTAWDRAFLKSVYSTEEKSVVQRSEITLNMVHQIAP